MPPKCSATSKKTEVKKKEKVIEDKTFGLKNKKGAKTQKFIAQVEKQVKSGGLHPLGLPNEKKLEKEKKLKEQKELAALFKPVIIQKIEAGADPKSVLCAYFKQGQCTKGDKCKFSHDLTVERKAEKRSIYVDAREVEKDGETMESWDETKLLEVVDLKHAEHNLKTNATTIICKFFLEAVEKSLYGWFWECPNGSKCIYRHALPAGYMLKKDKKKDDKRDEFSLEELIETERSALGGNTTKVTLESFLSWKKRKIEEKKQAQLEEEKKKLKDFKSGKQFGISGREMFSFNPDLVYDNATEDDEQTFDIERERDENEADFKEVDFSAYNTAKEVDGTGTIATDDRFEKLRQTLPSKQETPTENGTSDQGASSLAAGLEDEAGPINENLFLDEDLDGLDDELNDLDMND